MSICGFISISIERDFMISRRNKTKDDDAKDSTARLDHYHIVTSYTASSFATKFINVYTGVLWNWQMDELIYPQEMGIRLQCWQTNILILEDWFLQGDQFYEVIWIYQNWSWTKLLMVIWRYSFKLEEKKKKKKKENDTVLINAKWLICCVVLFPSHEPDSHCSDYIEAEQWHTKS